MTTMTAAAPGTDGRGALTVADGAVERIAARAITELDGVGGSASRVLGIAVGGEDLDQGAKVSAHVTGSTATLDVRLSVKYPLSVRGTTESAREHLIRRVGELSGLAITRVDITVTALHSTETETRRVR
ncbi:Asp23/Gls24 family envelope stress response protein [Amycolatopsis sp. TNS106]|uniref:Asp23/Gls24 family envelope stress response protein n=1 Tax=Amycolatopsis sp. TNS106 TaxID=2861750 RepID=UPI001C59D6EB|nr:Asp23/Gls24 family envelope stress response protein [Amycolatopsis sp. TNS106]QXV55739.1 Asp23/Gls24 family protein [Amycolatopsis sp. TNS106]